MKRKIYDIEYTFPTTFEELENLQRVLFPAACEYGARGEKDKAIRIAEEYDRVVYDFFKKQSAYNDKPT